MSEGIRISLFEVVGGPLCMASDDGQKVFKRLVAALKAEQHVSLSFHNVTALTAVFLNTAVGQLYGTFGEQHIRDLLKVEDIAQDDLALLKRVVDNAKLYFKDPKRFDKTVRAALEDENNKIVIGNQNHVVSHSYPPDKEGKGGYIPYNKTLTQKARENRKNPTAAEKKLWYEVLGNKRLDNLKFTRQKPLDEYIVDFYCAELMLAIEIDGDTHADQEQYDKRRTENLNRYGVEVIRYTNAEVLNNLEGVYQDLCERISERKRKKTP